MIVTEEEAKTKRCQEGFAASDGVTDGESVYQTMVPAPMTSVSLGAGYVGTLATQATAPMHCIGSACMAWRWATNGMLLDHKRPDGEQSGYCGKAGKP